VEGSGLPNDLPHVSCGVEGSGLPNDLPHVSCGVEGSGLPDDLPHVSCGPHAASGHFVGRFSHLLLALKRLNAPTPSLRGSTASKARLLELGLALTPPHPARQRPPGLAALKPPAASPLFPTTDTHLPKGAVREPTTAAVTATPLHPYC
jgi:hypothetical protein